MKTLTTKLAVAALLVAGASLQASEDAASNARVPRNQFAERAAQVKAAQPFITVVSAGAATFLAADAVQAGIDTWSANQNTTPSTDTSSKAKKALKAIPTAVRNYALPVAQLVATAALTAGANDHRFLGKSTVAYKIYDVVTPDVALGLLVAAAVAKNAWNKSTAAQKAADEAYVAGLAQKVGQEVANAQSSSSN